MYVSVSWRLRGEGSGGAGEEDGEETTTMTGGWRVVGGCVGSGNFPQSGRCGCLRSALSTRWHRHSNGNANSSSNSNGTATAAAAAGGAERASG